MWKPLPTDLTLPKDEVHIWRADLDLPTNRVDELTQTLSLDERARAERFYFERDRKRFIVGRGGLRAILGRYLGLDPTQLQFSYSSRGKPALANPSLDGRLFFNVSHSQGLALYGVSCDRAIGIDLEYIRPIEAEQLAKRFFSDPEYAAISSLPPELQKAAFFKGWVCKEAYLKATGEGLIGLEQVEVSVIPNEPAQLLSIAGDREAAKRWLLQELFPHPDYASAVVVEGQGVNIRFFSEDFGDF